MLQAIALLLLFARQAYSLYDYGYLNIDCGQDRDYVAYDKLTWRADSMYIDARCGLTLKIRDEDAFYPANTLRFFPDMNKNCYTVPVFIKQKYLIRAGFYYDNYDRLHKPPVFDLQFDANKWTTVVTSLHKPVFHEMVVVAQNHNISICVARIDGGGLPFISTIEVVQLIPGMYENMGSRHALFKKHRMNFGSRVLVGKLSVCVSTFSISYHCIFGAQSTVAVCSSNFCMRYPDPADRYGRVWEPAPSSRYPNLTAEFESLVSTVPDDPPLSVIKTAIQAASPSDSINLSFDMQESDGPLYVILYFAELARLSPGQNRTFDVYFNGADYNLTMSPVYQKCNEIYGYVAAAPGGFNLTLTPTKNISNSPPILSAMELYTVSELIENGTPAQDISGLRRLAQSSSSLARWSGDPCLPVAWQWLECNEEHPPRIIALYLAGLNLQYLYDFSDMQVLEIIDLENNSLVGEIPDFLGNLPMLKKLNLANNQLSGFVPESLWNSKISLNVSGNPDLIIGIPMRKNKSNDIGLIVGLWVAAISVVIGFFVAIFIIRRTRGETKVRAAEFSMIQVENQAGDPVRDLSLGQTENVITAAETERRGTGQDEVVVSVSQRVVAAEIEDAIFSEEKGEDADFTEEGGGGGYEDEVAVGIEDERGHATETGVAADEEARRSNVERLD